MSEKNSRDIIRSSGGFITDVSIRIKLILRLIADPRVNPLIKLLPIGSIIYFLVPDLAPGPIDDAAVLWLGSFVFVELCPPEVVEEHMHALKQTIPGEWREPNEGEDEIIEGEYWEE